MPTRTTLALNEILIRKLITPTRTTLALIETLVKEVNPITGTVSVTLDGLTSSSIGELDIEAILTKTLDELYLSSTGEFESVLTWGPLWQSG